MNDVRLIMLFCSGMTFLGARPSKVAVLHSCESCVFGLCCLEMRVTFVRTTTGRALGEVASAAASRRYFLLYGRIQHAACWSMVCKPSRSIAKIRVANHSS